MAKQEEKLLEPILQFYGASNTLVQTVLDLIPDQTRLLIEPFCGSARVSLHWPGPRLLGDIDLEAISVLLAAQAQPDELCGEVEWVGNLDFENYTHWLDGINKRRQSWLDCQCSATINDVVDAIYANYSVRESSELCETIKATSTRLVGATFFVGDYQDCLAKVKGKGKGIVVYCDPPCTSMSSNRHEGEVWSLRQHVTLADKAEELSVYNNRTVIVSTDDTEIALLVYGAAEEIYRVDAGSGDWRRIFVYRPNRGKGWGYDPRR